MKDSKKKIIIIIIAVIAVILILYRILWTGNNTDTEIGENNTVINEQSQEKNSDTQNQKENNGNSSEPVQETNNVFQKVDNRDDYFAIKDRLTMFYMYIAFINKDTYIDSQLVENVEDEAKELQTLGLTSIKNMLDTNYIESLEKTNKSIIQDAYKYRMYGDNSTNADYLMQITDMYKYKISDNQYLYLVNVSTSKKETQMLIKLDVESKRFSIFLEDYIEKYKYSSDMKKEDINISNSEIAENDNNSFNYNSTKEVNMVKEYFSLLKTNILNNNKKIYSLLDEEYKNKRFSTYEKFQEYLNETGDRYSNLTLSKYLVQNEDNGTIRYNLLDSNENCYVITVNAKDLLDYDIQLDDYTIESDEYKESYNKAEDVEKAYTDIAKFFKMINNKDYEAAYNVLGETYRKNYFPTLEKFKEYVKKNFFDYTTVTDSEDVTKSSSYYVCTINTVSKSGKEKTETFVVSLEEGTGFKLSFTIK